MKPAGHFLNLFPHEMRSGDVWDEGLEIVAIIQSVITMEWFILFNLTEPSRELGQWVRWPDRAPRRIFRPDKVA